MCNQSSSNVDIYRSSAEAGQNVHAIQRYNAHAILRCAGSQWHKHTWQDNPAVWAQLHTNTVLQQTSYDVENNTKCAKKWLCDNRISHHMFSVPAAKVHAMKLCVTAVPAGRCSLTRWSQVRMANVPTLPSMLPWRHLCFPMVMESPFFACPTLWRPGQKALETPPANQHTLNPPVLAECWHQSAARHLREFPCWVNSLLWSHSTPSGGLLNAWHTCTMMAHLFDCVHLHVQIINQIHWSSTVYRHWKMGHNVTCM